MFTREEGKEPERPGSSYAASNQPYSWRPHTNWAVWAMAQPRAAQVHARAVHHLCSSAQGYLHMAPRATSMIAPCKPACQPGLPTLCLPHAHGGTHAVSHQIRLLPCFLPSFSPGGGPGRSSSAHATYVNFSRKGDRLVTSYHGAAAGEPARGAALPVCAPCAAVHHGRLTGLLVLVDPPPRY